jgi:hypothetical protein
MKSDPITGHWLSNRCFLIDNIMVDHEYHIVELNTFGMTTEVTKWLIEKYGEQGNGRWFYRHPTIYFTDSKDHLMFTLRWS